jgi:hypothetical protein
VIRDAHLAAERVRVGLVWELRHLPRDEEEQITLVLLSNATDTAEEERWRQRFELPMVAQARKTQNGQNRFEKPITSMCE